MEHARESRQGRRALPPSLESGPLGETDWATTIVAACSFLLHFGAAASIYRDWTDPVVDDELAISQIIESLHAAALPDVEHPEAEAVSPAATAPGIETRPPARERTGSGAGARATANTTGGMTNTRARELAASLDRMNLEVTGALGGTSRSIEGVLHGDVPMGLLDGVAENPNAAGRGAGLHLGEPSGVIRPGSQRPGLETIGDVGPAAPMTTSTGARPRGPIGHTVVEPPADPGGVVPDAPAVVARLAAGFRRCYQRGLDIDPSMKGSVRLHARIGPNGEVVSVSPSSSAGLSGEVVSCIASRVQGAQFAPPTTGGATIVIPVKLVPQ